MKSRIRVIASVVIVLVAAASATANAQRGRGRGRSGEAPGRIVVVPKAEQTRRLEKERERTTTYQRHLDDQVRAIRAQQTAIDAQRRLAAYRAQQRYAEELAQQQRRLQRERDYARDPYMTAPVTYRYVVNGVRRETNKYGADVLRRAVNFGYRQGVLAGEADRRDRWRADYSNALAYRDADYGYEGNYIDESDYNYYFRQGFQRGYSDGYSNQLQYGTSSAGTPAILAAVLAAILGLAAIR